ncbi:hypothetical protein [Myxococcus sp. RHSTA-1-4]|uniref:hypothetical protein n=1 Tax=Myxococcus sp. RHSTA-1-4 TaxID=2874601 RepID=UPI001CBCB7EC|nr:hypothetical protein [Myxococcus sp. RHSTA-1-4]MBZ4417930.1 hypothetical protein [Myxococcus sp. RHSTA-1-4]
MRLAVTGLGLVTAVGHGVVGSCAALRAGASRPHPLPGFVTDDEPGESVPVTGHPVVPFAEGFFQTGAWVRLASGAFEDLLHATELPTHVDFWRRTCLMALAPLVDEERFGWSLASCPEALRDAYVRPLLSLMDVPLPEENARALALGSCGLAEAATQAWALLSGRRVDRVLVLAADSFVDPVCLAWLALHRRLKSPQRQVGLMPGEAGAALLVETPGAARARAAPVAAHLEAVAVSPHDISAASALAHRGRALANAVKRVLPEGAAPFRGDVLVDLNGEEWKAQVWGHANVLLQQDVDFPRCRLVLPADSLGETGAASAPLAVAAAAWGFRRGHAAGERALVCSISDAGRVSALLLGRADAPSGP